MCQKFLPTIVTGIQAFLTTHCYKSTNIYHQLYLQIQKRLYLQIQKHFSSSHYYRSATHLTTHLNLNQQKRSTQSSTCVAVFWHQYLHNSFLKHGWVQVSQVSLDVAGSCGLTWHTKKHVLNVVHLRFVCWLFNVPATGQCISGTDLLRQFYMLPHWDRSCRLNVLPHPVTVYWHRADQSQCWPCNARRLAG